MPLIFIIVPVYKVELYLRCCVDSILAQSFNKVIQNEENFGLNKTFKKVVQMIDSKYVAFLGGDDYWIASDKIKKQ
jgi:glycosyltransferase involved in cell wall biosynthesis